MWICKILRQSVEIVMKTGVISLCWHFQLTATYRYSLKFVSIPILRCTVESIAQVEPDGWQTVPTYRTHGAGREAGCADSVAKAKENLLVLAAPTKFTDRYVC